ncbi:Putative gustatory receptor 28b [Eumeta japonica]|uniref:Gustatory receptor n=1 Tax=Eumeta variegata TaxID=151549 RepID=A0A4C1V3I2_EUMVA|nr:Putative gustatory receptor 28b [Eumeta japonica]
MNIELLYRDFKHLRRHMSDKEVKRPRNIIEANNLTRMIAKICGATVLERFTGPDGRVSRRFSVLGLCCFLFWFCLYFWCTCVAKSRDETIIRVMYNTKLKGYGDDTEMLLMFGLSLYNMWKIPFAFSGNVECFQRIIDIDNAIERLGVSINFSRHSKTVFRLALAQVIVSVLRLLYILVSIHTLRVDLPLHRTLHVIISNAFAVMGLMHFLNYLVVLTHRFKLVNKVLKGMTDHEDREKIFVTSKAYVRSNISVVREKVSSSKLKTCSRIYGMLYEATERTNELFGFMTLLTVSVAFMIIVLNMFYLMEATASGLFRKPDLYVNFLFYTLWHFCSSVGIIYFIVHFCENTTKEVHRLCGSVVKSKKEPLYFVPSVCSFICM